MASSVYRMRFAKKFISWRTFYETKISMSSETSVSMLAKLRKMTGYSMSNCKKALALHADDIERAKVWLHEEAKKQGWSKIANLESRPAVQGLVAVYSKDSVGAMVEVNCETDFVSRNTEFQAFVTTVLSSCLNYSLGSTVNEDCRKLHLDSESLNKLPSGSSTLGDLTASAVGKFGERTVLRRAVCFRTGNGVLLHSFSHPHNQCADLANGTFGRYASLVAYRPTQVLSDVNSHMLSNYGHQLCQHIIGMNPEVIGDLQLALKLLKEKTVEEDIEMKKLDEKDRKDDIIVKDSKVTEETDEQNEDEDEHNEEENSEKLIDSNETRLVFQQFLTDPNIRVAEFLEKNSLEVLDFQRFECGEVQNYSR